MMVFLMPVCPAILFLILLSFFRRNDLAFSCAVISFLGIIWLSTELLSFKRAITSSNIVKFWLLFFILLVIVLFILLFTGKGPELKNLKQLSEFTVPEKVLLSVIVMLVIVVGVESVLVVPNNWDSMTYHIPRVMHWAQNHSVSYYFTLENRQNCSPPFAEYILLHLYLLSFSRDTYFNLIQYFAYLVSMAGIWSVCGKLFDSRVLKLLAVFLFAAAPIVIAEATTTQVDLVAAAIFILFVDLVLYLWQQNRLGFDIKTVYLVLLVAVSIGLEFLTKNSVCLAMAGVLIAFLIRRVKQKDKALYLIVYIFLSGMTVMAICALSFYRNYTWYGDILARSYFSSISIGSFDPRYLVLNLYKNFSLMISNKIIRNALIAVGYFLGSIMGVGIDDDPITFSSGTLFSKTLPASYHHDTASVTVIAFLFIIAAITVIVMKIRKLSVKRSEDGIMNGMLLGALLMMLITRYQKWGIRLQIIPVVIMILFIVFEADKVISSSGSRNEGRLPVKAAVNGIVTVIVLISLIPAAKTLMAQNASTPNELSDNMIRFSRYFVNRNEISDDYIGACDFINDNDLNSVGLLLGGDKYEYPIWAMMERNVVIEHIDLSGGYPGYAPDCILTTGLIEEDKAIVFNNEQYYPQYISESGNLNVFVKVDDN